MPELPNYWHQHTAINGVLCGGDGPAKQKCYSFTSQGNWEESHQLIYPRYYHSVWDIYPGVAFLLIGGHDQYSTHTKTTTELVYYNGTVVQSFNLQYETG